MVHFSLCWCSRPLQRLVPNKREVWFNLKNKPISLRHYHQQQTLKPLARFREGLFSFGGLAFVWQTGERLAPFAIPLSSLLLHKGPPGSIYRGINSACVMLAQSCCSESPSIPNTLIADRCLQCSLLRPAVSPHSALHIRAIDASGCSCEQHMATFGMHNATFRRASCNGQGQPKDTPIRRLTNCIVDCSGNG